MAHTRPAGSMSEVKLTFIMRLKVALALVVVEATPEGRNGKLMPFLAA